MELTLLFGFLPNNNLHVIGVVWTLGVIFVFYIIFLYFVFLLYSKKRAWVFSCSVNFVTFCRQIYFMKEPFVIASFVCRYFFCTVSIFYYGWIILSLQEGTIKIC